MRTSTLSRNSRTTDSRGAGKSAEFFVPLMPRRAACALIALSWLLCGAAIPAQQKSGSSILIEDPRIKSALDFIRENEPWVIEQQIRLTEIPAPPLKEQRRAEALKSDFEQLGLRDVRIDGEGNVIGVRPGRRAHPNLVFSAHLDTVFPEETDVKVRREGTVLKAPGIGDDGRGLALMLGVIRALQDSGIETEGPITFVGTVGEEGLGDLRGVKHLFQESLKNQIDYFISVDGTGLSIANTAVGSYRYRVFYKGPGGHSYGAFGMANPIHALGRAIAKIADFQTPSDPKTTFNVGRIQGGTSVNSIAFEASLEADLRSSEREALEALDEKFKSALQLALNEENARWNDRGKLELVVNLVGDRPAGSTPESSLIVRKALEVTDALGLATALREGSTDSNIPMSLGIPAVTIGGGGRGRGAHSLHESYDIQNSWQGTQRAFLLALSLTLQ
ncbi:MAG: M20/M25/M40 family metallo-hydrolase, partial [Bryobacteraceae bacterium]